MNRQPDDSDADASAAAVQALFRAAAPKAWRLVVDCLDSPNLEVSFAAMVFILRHLGYLDGPTRAAIEKRLRTQQKALSDGTSQNRSKQQS